eukprot:403340318
MNEPVIQNSLVDILSNQNFRKSDISLSLNEDDMNMLFSQSQIRDSNIGLNDQAQTNKSTKKQIALQVQDEDDQFLQENMSEIFSSQSPSRQASIANQNQNDQYQSNFQQYNQSGMSFDTRMLEGLLSQNDDISQSNSNKNHDKFSVNNNPQPSNFPFANNPFKSFNNSNLNKKRTNQFQFSSNKKLVNKVRNSHIVQNDYQLSVNNSSNVMQNASTNKQSVQQFMGLRPSDTIMRDLQDLSENDDVSFRESMLDNELDELIITNNFDDEIRQFQNQQISSSDNKMINQQRDLQEVMFMNGSIMIQEEVDDIQFSQMSQIFSQSIRQSSAQYSNKSQNKVDQLDIQNLIQFDITQDIINIMRDKFKIKQLFEWQYDCFSNKKVQQGGIFFLNLSQIFLENLIYSAPTSAGKTLVSDLIMMKNLIKYPTLKTIIIMPYVSLIGEKEYKIKQLLQTLNMQIQSIHSHKNELHMIGDESRGYLLELMLSKFQYLNSTIKPQQLSNKLSPYVNLDQKIQIIAMSATFPNLQEISQWLNAELFVTNFRPVQISEFLKVSNELLTPDGTQLIRKLNPNVPQILKQDRLNIFQLIQETLQQNGSILVFCSSKDKCEEFCRILMLSIKQCLESIGIVLTKEVLMNCINEHLREFLSNNFYQLLEKGCAFHHSGLAMAGRYGFDTEADSILCVQNQSEKKKAIELMNRKLERINSCLNIERKGLSRVILESIGTKIVQDSVQMKLFLQNTLLYTQISSLIVEESQGKDQQLNNIDLEHQAWVQMQKQGKQALDFLIFNEIVVQQAQMIERQLHFKFETTKLGLAIIKSNLSPEDGLMVYIDLQNAQQRIVLQNELHLLYLMTPVSNTCIRINWELFHWIYRNLAPIELKICELIGIKEDYIVILNDQEDKGLVSGITDFKAFAEVNKELIIRMRHARFYSTILLKDLLNDYKNEEVMSFYRITSGDIQAFQQRCSAFSSMVVTFCHELNWWNMYNLLNQYMDRINFVVQEELEELLQLSVIDAPKARAIYESGFTSIYHISKARPMDILKALQKTLIIQRQFSTDMEDLFKQGTTEHSSATISKAEEIIQAAKNIMRVRNLARAREIIKKKREWLKQQKELQNNEMQKLQQQQYNQQ